MSSHGPHRGGLHGPLMWAISLAAGMLLGWGLTFVAPAQYYEAGEADHGGGYAAPPSADTAPEAPPADGRTSHVEGLVRGVDVAGAGDEVEGTTIGAIDDGGSAPQADPAAAAEEAVQAGPRGGLDEPLETADEHHDDHGPAPIIPLWLAIPFVTLLLSIALMPFVSEPIWHRHFADFAFFLGGITLAYYLAAFDQPDYFHGLSYGQYQMLHVGLEYYQFIALIGGLYVASGGILIDVQGRGRPAINTAMLAFGAVIANIVGTTGASVLLIRPFMRVNRGRLKPMHVVMFIFIVSNCGGCLTPIGDPPLYLGFLKGVPFEWTLINLWPMWLACVGMLLAIFFVLDTRIGPPEEDEAPADEPVRVRISGLSGFIALGLIIAGVFLDPTLKRFTSAFEGVPLGATFQILVAAGAYAVASRENLKANEFTFFPVKEVGLLFVGIFTTMAPALGYLAEHGDQLGLETPTRFYFATGLLSGFLDNAPTYLNFLQVAFASLHIPLNPENVHEFLATERGHAYLAAISLGAVFFGAMTYIGNGPNFMVRAIAESSGLKMPSFFGYVMRALVTLLPVLVVIWLVFVLGSL